MKLGLFAAIRCCIPSTVVKVAQIAVKTCKKVSRRLAARNAVNEWFNEQIEKDMIEAQVD